MDTTFHFSPPYTCRNALPQSAFQRPEFFTDAKVEFQIAVVDGSKFETQMPEGKIMALIGKAGHAVDGGHGHYRCKNGAMIARALDCGR